jgi:broad specificity phosphatase PhoE
MEKNTFIFVRHGDCGAKPPGRSRPRESPLTPLGREQARAAARWLEDLPAPDVLAHTETRRTRETAGILQEGMDPGVRIAAPRPGFRDLAGLDRKWAEWIGGTGPCTVVFAGHHSTQQALARAFGLPLRRKERAVVALERRNGSWVLLSWAVARRLSSGNGYVCPDGD